MRVRRAIVAISVVALVTLIGVNLVAAVSASNAVPVSRAGDTTQAIDANSLKPAECDGITIQNKVSGSAIITGTLANDWIVGSSVVDTIDGLAGDDCIEGHGGADIITGGLGNDVCIGGGGIDTFVGCETQIQ